MSASPIDPHRLAEDTKRQLLERAAELDQDSLTLQQLREAAVEAGISAAAFDQAVHEWRHTMPVASAVSRPVTVAARLLRNFAALASGWAALLGLSAIDRLFAVPWLVHKLTDPLGLAVGAAIAVKLRVRTATAVLGGLAVSQTAEYLLDFISGAPAIHGFAPHVAVMLAGIAGVAVGQHFSRRGSRHGPSTPFAEPPSSAKPDSGALELRTASA